MSNALARASRLKPDIRLAQVVSEFEAALSAEQKATFRSYKSKSQTSPPNSGDFMRMTAEIDHLTAQKVRGGRCFGPRLSSFLQSVQQFVACGDVAIGSTQDPIACSVWSLVRMTLLLAANFSAYFDRLSNFLMAIGRSAPRYETMAMLYPQSKELRSYLCEYFIVVVRLFQSQFKVLQKSSFGQFLAISFLSEADLKTYQSECEFWASSIKEEVNKLMATDLVRQSSRTSALLKFTDAESLRKKHKARLRILNSCSTFNYEKAWKETRKIGYTTLLNQAPEYQHWKVQPDSCTLVCSGKLGSGKSVLLANMVDDLNLHVQEERLPVAYYFCQHDSPESLQARTIIGCLARQLLETTLVLSGLGDFADATSPVVDLDRITGLLLKVLPSRAYFIIDGLDECDDRQREVLTSQLRQLQDTTSLLVCLSFRSEADNASRVRLKQFAKPSTLQIPDDNPDINDYITTELERRLESGRLKIGESALILEIRDALLQGAQGMFLWVALQIGSLCAEPTDEAIRQALARLPRGLPSTFSRILQQSEALGKYQEQTLRLIVAACRPLTIDELREALSVVPGDADWKPANIINDIYSALACCGSLVIVDEEDSTVRLVHHSVKQFLLGGLGEVPNGIFTLNSALRTMGAIMVTYLNYGVFDNQLSTRVVPQLDAASAPSKILHSTLNTPGSVQKVALRLLRSQKQSTYNVGKVLTDERGGFHMHHTDQFNFLSYAKSYWFQHIRLISPEEPVMYKLLLQVLRRRMIDLNARDENDQTSLSWAAEKGHEAVVQHLLEKGAKIESKDGSGRTPLSWAAKNGHEVVARLLINKGADIKAADKDGRTPLHLASRQGHLEVARLLIDKGADINKADDKDGRTPLHLASEQGHLEVARLLIDKGADINKAADNYDGRTPLYLASEQGHLEVARLLIDKGADIKAADNYYGRTPLYWASRQGHLEVARLLIDKGADINKAADKDGRTPLYLASGHGHLEVARLLIDKGADINKAADYGGTPLHSASRHGHLEVARLLKGAKDAKGAN